jgi:hypothetical protein
MDENEVYAFHQTPPLLAIELIKEIPIVSSDIVLEPFKGEGSFYNNFPECQKEWCEVTQGRDWLSHTTPVDWVITNPPFRLDNGIKRENSFWKILLHYATMVNKGMAFLGNDRCISTLTPRRLDILQNHGLYLHNIVVCNVKKWRGRYYFLIFKKEPCIFYRGILGSFD